MTTTYYTATTLDGFIATTDHSLDWLLSRDVDRAGPMGYEEFYAGVGAILMGSSTYRWVLDRVRAGTDSWGYEVPCWVFTHREPDPLDGADLRFVQGDVARHFPEIQRAAAGKDVWVVGGGDLAGQLADRGLLDEVVVSVAPVTLGDGAPLLPRHVELALVEVARNRDFACMRYRVVRD